MVLAHQLTIGALDGGGIISRFYPQHIAGIFQSRPALRLLPAGVAAALAVRLLLRPATELRPALHHAQELLKLSAGDAQLIGNHKQHFTFVGMQIAIGKSRLQLNFQKHPN